MVGTIDQASTQIIGQPCVAASNFVSLCDSCWPRYVLHLTARLGWFRNSMEDGASANVRRYASTLGGPPDMSWNFAE